MGVIKFGEIDSIQILDNEFRIRVLENLMEWIINNNPNMTLPSQAIIKELRKSVISHLKKKYPKSGISFKGE